MILVINSGSSSIKFGLYQRPGLNQCFSGQADALQSARGTLRHGTGTNGETTPLPHADHQTALEQIITLLQSRVERLELAGIGHRVVHGGELFSEPTLINEQVVDSIEKLCPLAPLHNPAHLLGIRSMQTLFPGVPQVAVFDTAFHQTMPSRAFRYAIPENYLQAYGVRRYGAHGTSHQLVAERAAGILGRPVNELQLITVHLGNGCSACAVRDGRSIDTTMGLTPQEGMMMGTRSGDVDPTLPLYLAAHSGASLESVTNMLTRGSGLLGVSGVTRDCRELETLANAGHENAGRALDLFCYRAAKSILGITAALSRLDAVAFTGGIGENSAFVRRQITGHLALLGLHLNDHANDNGGLQTGGLVSTGNGPAVLVVRTDEEQAIARHTAALVSQR